MRRRIAFTLLAAVFAVGVTAAQTTYPKGSSKSGQSTKAQQSQSVTLTGCIAAADEGTSGTTGGTTPGKGASTAHHYKLTNVSSASPTGTSGGGTAAPTGDVMLMGKNLQAHVGHKVQVTGRMQHEAAGKSGTAAGGPGETLHITAIKMVSSSCSGQ